MPQSPLHDAGKTYCYPIVMGQQTKTTRDMVEHIQEVCTLTKVDCNAVIEAMSNYIINMLVSGNHVHIDGLGTLSPALHFVDSSKEAALQAPGDVRVTDVNFRPERELMMMLKEQMRFERKEAVRSSNVSIATVVVQLQKYFADARELTSHQFESMFGFKRSRANTVLKKLVDQSKLCRYMMGQTYIYYAGPNLYPPQASVN